MSSMTYLLSLKVLGSSKFSVTVLAYLGPHLLDTLTESVFVTIYECEVEVRRELICVLRLVRLEAVGKKLT